jgi:hypothetical protein
MTTTGTKERDLVVTAVDAELADRDTAVWFALLAEAGPDAIEAQGWQLKEVLSDRGVKVPLRDEQDAMLELAHELLPDSPAGEDPRQALFREMGRWASAQPEEAQERLRALLAEDSFLDAWDSGVRGFRNYLRSRCAAALRGEAA